MLSDAIVRMAREPSQLISRSRAAQEKIRKSALWPAKLDALFKLYGQLQPQLRSTLPARPHAVGDRRVSR
jgi:hypothetical protein